MKRRIILGMCVTTAVFLLIAALFLCAFSKRLLLREYDLNSPLVQDEITIVHISDLHETAYGEGQSQLIRAIRKAGPDIIVMTGDMADGYRDDAPLRQLISAIAGEYPCYYVSGNHEAWAGKADEYKSYYREMGVKVLEGEGERITVGNTSLDIFGIDDPGISSDAQWQAQLSDCLAVKDSDTFSVLLTHRPERIENYIGFDLILSGHAHGGQVRVPLLINGLYAPDQGWFPRYAGGQYAIGGGTMIVSRGLALNDLPRIFNRPELVKITIGPG